MCPIVPNALWALDFQFDVTVDGRTLTLLNIIDEFTREALAIDVDRSIDAERGHAPAFVRFDNGPEFVAHGDLSPAEFAATWTINQPQAT